MNRFNTTVHSLKVSMMEPAAHRFIFTGYFMEHLWRTRQTKEFFMDRGPLIFTAQNTEY